MCPSPCPTACGSGRWPTARSADIKPGDFVGSAAVRGADGKLHAEEVHIFPENLRGTGEGHRPMSGPQESMTNAAVAGIAARPRAGFSR